MSRQCGASLLTETRCSIVVGKPCRADLQSRSHVWHSLRLSIKVGWYHASSWKVKAMFIHTQDVRHCGASLLTETPLLWVSYEASFLRRLILQILIRDMAAMLTQWGRSHFVYNDRCSIIVEQDIQVHVCKLQCTSLFWSKADGSS